MNYFRLGLCLALALPLCGCAAAAGLEGLGAVDLAAEGAVGGAVVEGAGARLLISDGLGVAATSRGVLPEALSRLTNGGTQTAVLSVDAEGLIRGGTRPIAAFRENTIVTPSGEAIGTLQDGWIYELRDGVRGQPVARLHAFVPGNLMRLQTALVDNGLSDRLFVEVMQVTGDQYLVRLPDGSMTWIGANLAMLVVLPSTSRSQCPDGNGTLVRSSGHSIVFESCTEEAEVFRLYTSAGLVIVDREDVAVIVPGALMTDANDAAIQLTGGYAVYGQAVRTGQVVSMRSSTGDLLIADVSRLAAHDTEL